MIKQCKAAGKTDGPFSRSRCLKDAKREGYCARHHSDIVEKRARAGSRRIYEMTTHSKEKYDRAIAAVDAIRDALPELGVLADRLYSRLPEIIERGLLAVIQRELWAFNGYSYEWAAPVEKTEDQGPSNAELDEIYLRSSPRTAPDEDFRSVPVSDLVALLKRAGHPPRKPGPAFTATGRAGIKWGALVFSREERGFSVWPYMPDGKQATTGGYFNVTEAEYGRCEFQPEPDGPVWYVASRDEVEWLDMG